MTERIPLVEELTWRGLLFQSTPGFADLVGGAETSGYCGFDPTASSLHVGNLIPVMGLVHLQRAGHTPIALVGGGTGLIGDPSGKSTERQLAGEDVVAANALRIKAQLERFLDFDGRNAALMRNNADWLTPLKAIEFMRDIGKHFTVNFMLAKESVQSRMEAGISFTEFSYMLLQAYDFLELFRREGAQLQLGGSDQWGNITAGVELIRRAEGGSAQALTMPLVTTSGGSKFGKTEAGAVWLDPALTSPYRFYQFWINAEDSDVGRFLRYFTLQPRQRVEDLERSVETSPEKREAQQVLAHDITARVHGEAAAGLAAQVSLVLFGKTDPATLSEAALAAMSAEVPFAEKDRSATIVDCLVTLGFAASKGAARRVIQQGGAYLNGARVSDDAPLSGTEPLNGGFYLLKKGARDYAVVRTR